MDHIVPLCAQPVFLATVLDTAANMAWEAAAEAEVKDRFERRLCQALGRAARLQLGPEAYRDALVTYWLSVATLDNAALRQRRLHQSPVTVPRPRSVVWVGAAPASHQV